MSMDEEQMKEQIERELREYAKILAKKNKDKELSESEIPNKPICLSELRSPIKSHIEASEDEQHQLLDKVSGLIIEYGRRVLP